MARLMRTMESRHTALPKHSTPNNNNNNSSSTSHQPMAWELPSTPSCRTPRLRAAASTAPCGHPRPPPRLPGPCLRWWGLRYISITRPRPTLVRFPPPPQRRQGSSSMAWHPPVRRPAVRLLRLTTGNSTSQAKPHPTNNAMTKTARQLQPMTPTEVSPTVT